MLEHTQKPPTETVVLCLTGPAAKMDEALEQLAALGFAVREEEDATAWREAFPYTDAEMPGVFLSGARYREGLTQAALALATGIPRRHISEMENGKRPIGKLSARKLSKALKVDPRRFLAV